MGIRHFHSATACCRAEILDGTCESLQVPNHTESGDGGIFGAPCKCSRSIAVYTEYAVCDEEVHLVVSDRTVCRLVCFLRQTARSLRN